MNWNLHDGRKRIAFSDKTYYKLFYNPRNTWNILKQLLSMSWNLPDIQAISKVNSIEVTQYDTKIHLGNSKKDRHFHLQRV